MTYVDKIMAEAQKARGDVSTTGGTANAANKEPPKPDPKKDKVDLPRTTAETPAPTPEKPAAQQPTSKEKLPTVDELMKRMEDAWKKFQNAPEDKKVSAGIELAMLAMVTLGAFGKGKVSFDSESKKKEDEKKTDETSKEQIAGKNKEAPKQISLNEAIQEREKKPKDMEQKIQSDEASIAKDERDNSENKNKLAQLKTASTPADQIAALQQAIDVMETKLTSMKERSKQDKQVLTHLQSEGAMLSKIKNVVPPDAKISFNEAADGSILGIRLEMTINKLKLAIASEMDGEPYVDAKKTDFPIISTFSYYNLIKNPSGDRLEINIDKMTEKYPDLKPIVESAKQLLQKNNLTAQS